MSLAKISLFIAAFLIIYAYAGYPLLLALLSLLRRRKPAPLKDQYPTITVLIAAYNEENAIAEKIRQTLALDYPADRFDILVLSDCSTDNTDDVVRSFKDPRVRLLRVPERHGKTHAQNLGVLQCTSEILVFSDATTVYHPQALKFIAANYSDPRVGAVSGCYKYFDENGSPTGAGTLMFWDYENQIKRMQSNIHTISGCCGCIYSVKRSLYTSLPDDIISDLVQPLHVIRQGAVVRFETRALAYEEATESSQQEFSMRVRVITRGIRGIASVKELLNPLRHPWVAFQLWSHKVLRWAVPINLLVIFGCSIALAHEPFFRALLILQLAFYTFAAFAAVFPIHRVWKPLSLPLYFCTLNLAALVSMFECIRGRKYVVWQTVRKSSNAN